MIAIGAAAGVALTLLLILPRLFLGPTLYDRLLSAAALLVRVAVACAAIAVAVGEASFADVAFAFLLGAFATSAAALKFFRARSFQPPLAGDSR